MATAKKYWYASDTARNAILFSIFVLNLFTVLFVVCYAIPVYVSVVHEGYLEVAREHRLTQYENQLQWQSMMQQFFIPVSEVDITPVILPAIDKQ